MSYGRPNPYSHLVSNRDLLSAVYEMGRGRGVVINYSKNEIENSFTRPVFPSDRDKFTDLLLSLPATRGGYPGVHITHAEYDTPPRSFGDEGKRSTFHFFLDIDGRHSLKPAQRVAATMVDELEHLNVPCWVKFSGASGFHVHIPSDAFPDSIDGRPFPSLAPDLFLNIKHFLIRTASSTCSSDLLNTVIHPKRYYTTTQGIQRLPFSLHESTGLLALPLVKQEIPGFNPATAKTLEEGDVDLRLDAMRTSGSVDDLLPILEEERHKPPPFYHRR